MSHRELSRLVNVLQDSFEGYKSRQVFAVSRRYLEGSQSASDSDEHEHVRKLHA